MFVAIVASLACCLLLSIVVLGIRHADNSISGASEQSDVSTAASAESYSSSQLSEVVAERSNESKDYLDLTSDQHASRIGVMSELARQLNHLGTPQGEYDDTGLFQSTVPRIRRNFPLGTGQGNQYPTGQMKPEPKKRKVGPSPTSQAIPRISNYRIDPHTGWLIPIENQVILKAPPSAPSDSPPDRKVGLPKPRLQSQRVQAERRDTRVEDSDIEALIAAAHERSSRMSVQDIEGLYGYLDLMKLSGLHAGDIPIDSMLHRSPPETNYTPLVNRFLNLGIKLFHFTARQNSDSISLTGLFCSDTLRQRKMHPTMVSSLVSQEQDRVLGLDQYVHLCFTLNAKMAWAHHFRSTQPIVWFEVSPIVLEEPKVLFCRDYANKRGAELLPIASLTDLDLYALATQCERVGYWQLLVPKTIRQNRMRKVSASLYPQEGRSIWQ